MKNPVNKLIHHFPKKRDVTFMYVMHDMDLCFVTYRKHGSVTSVNKSEKKEKFIAIYKAVVEAWKNKLKVIHSTRVPVTFTWYHDKVLCYCLMFHDILGYDVIFGATKGRRFFLAASIDVNSKLFARFHYFYVTKVSTQLSLGIDDSSEEYVDGLCIISKPVHCIQQSVQ